MSQPNESPEDTSEGAVTERESILLPSPVLLLIVFVSGVILDRIRPVSLVPRPYNLWLGLVSFGAGTALFGGAIRSMRQVGASPDHDDESPELLTDGVFQYSRNPIYAGNCLQYLGLGLAYNSLWHLLLLIPVVGYLERVIEREEAHLQERFEAEFEAYRESVRRWL